jgi:hypothetical protein
LAITPLGPRDRDWFWKVSTGSIHPKEFFPWFDAGLGADYFPNRALVQMWNNVRWRNPVNESETALLKSVVNSLKVAYNLNNALDFPYGEWIELLNLYTAS